MLSALSLEAARSSRSSCKICRNSIAQGDPRVGLQRDDEWASMAWHHAACFNWGAHNVKSRDDVAAVAGFALLSVANQQKVVEAMGSSGRAPPLAGAKRAAADAPAAAGGAAKKGRPAAAASKVAQQIDEQLPLSMGISYIEYARVKKPSDCMLCKGKIKNGEPRVGNRVQSNYYEGIMTRWMHLTCALNTRQVKRITQLEGWDRMGYDVNLEIRQCTGEALSNAQEEELKTTMEALEETQDLLCLNLTHDDLIAALELNGVSASDLLIQKDSIAMAVLLSDYLAHGTPEDCPVCGNAALSFSAGRVTCWGYVDGLSKCQFKAQSCQRYKFKLPPAWAEAEWFEALSGDAHGAQAESAKGRKGGKSKGKGKKAAPQKATLTLTAGLLLQEDKPAVLAHSTTVVTQDDVHCAQASSRPARLPPEKGSPILQVHRGYEQTGKMRYASVVVDEDGVTVYNANFTETNLKTHMNRFYIVQLLQLSAPFSGYEIFCHWGRIGSKWEEEVFNKYRSTFQTYAFSTKTDAIQSFKQWFSKKTGNEWDNRHNFRTRPGMYAFVELSSTVSGGGSKRPGKKEEGEAGARAHAAIDERVACLVELLFDEDNILHSMQKADINLEEMPLGQVNGERVDKAKEILARVQALLSAHPASGASTQELRIWESKLEATSTEFWRCIPSRNTAILDSKAKINARLQVLDMLEDIATTQGISSKARSLQDLFGELRCTIRPLPSNDETFQAIGASLEHTAEPAVDKGRMCGFLGDSRVELLEVFEMTRDGEAEAFAKHNQKQERQLLWHGTNIATAAAIVSSGLRIMGSGGRVGKGLYLADEAGKSGHYVRTSQDGTGIMFLAEAALGRQFQISKETTAVHAFCAAPHGYDSVKAVGKTRPDPSGDVTLQLDGIPCKFATGRPQLVKEYAASSFSQNEFLVYNQDQVRLRYLVLVRLHSKGQAQRVKPSLVPTAVTGGAPAPTGAGAGLVPPGMSEDDMLQAAINASLRTVGAAAGAAGAATAAAGGSANDNSKSEVIVLDP